MLDRTAEIARVRAEEYKWRTLLGEVVADCVTTGLRGISGARLARDTPADVQALLVVALFKDDAFLHALARAHRWEIARRETVTPSPDLSYPRPRGADRAGI